MKSDLFGDFIPAIFGPGFRAYNGDMREILTAFPDNSIDAGLMDPPYHLTTETRYSRTTLDSATDSNSARARNPAAADGLARLAKGFMGKAWDGGDVAFQVETWREVLRVLKPGAFLCAFGGTKTYHRMATAIDDAGFDIMDCLQWLYGSGMPKQGWLKPGCELITLARKPLIGTRVANVAAWGTGRLNIEDCRVDRGGVSTVRPSYRMLTSAGNGGRGLGNQDHVMPRLDQPFFAGSDLGGYPSNVLHDGSPEVLALFPRAVGQKGNVRGDEPSALTGDIYGQPSRRVPHPIRIEEDKSAARFFYHVKASKLDRFGSKHPTVKPLNLMGYLATLITPPGGTVLDAFAGSGTTLEAARNLGFMAVGIEQDFDYFWDIERRMTSEERIRDARRVG